MRIPTILLYRSPVLRLFSFGIFIWSLSFTTYFLGTFFWSKGEALTLHRQLTLSIEATVLTGHLAGDAFLVIVGFFTSLRVFGIEKPPSFVQSSLSVSTSTPTPAASSINPKDNISHDDNDSDNNDEETLTISQRMIKYINLRWFLQRLIYHILNPYYIVYILGCIVSFCTCNGISWFSTLRHPINNNDNNYFSTDNPLSASTTSLHIPGLQGFRNTTETIVTTYPSYPSSSSSSSSSLSGGPLFGYLLDVFLTLTTELHYEDQCTTGPHLWPLALAIRFQVYFLFLTLFSVIGCYFASYLMIMCTSCATKVCIHNTVGSTSSSSSSSSSSSILPSDRHNTPPVNESGMCQTCTKSVPRSYFVIRKIINYLFRSPDHTILLSIWCVSFYGIVWRIYYTPPLVSNSIRYLATSISNAYYDYYFTHGLAHISSFGWGILSGYYCLRWGYGYHTTLENRLLWTIVAVITLLGYGYDISTWITLLPSSYIYTGLVRKLSVWYYVTQVCLGLYIPLFSGSFAMLLFFCYRSYSLNRFLLAPSFAAFMMNRNSNNANVSGSFRKILYIFFALLHPIFRFLLNVIVPGIQPFVSLLFVLYPLLGYGIFVYFPPYGEYFPFLITGLVFRSLCILLPTVYILRKVLDSVIVRTIVQTILRSFSYVVKVLRNGLLSIIPNRIKTLCIHRLSYLIYLSNLCTDIIAENSAVKDTAPEKNAKNRTNDETNIRTPSSSSVSNPSVENRTIIETFEEEDDKDVWLWGKDWEIMELTTTKSSSLRNRRNPNRSITTTTMTVTTADTPSENNLTTLPPLPPTMDTSSQGNHKVDDDSAPIVIMDEEDYDNNKDIDDIIVQDTDENEENENQNDGDDDDGDGIEDDDDDEEEEEDDTGFGGLSRKDEQRAQRVAALVIARIRRDAVEHIEFLQDRMINSSGSSSTAVTTLSNLRNEVDNYIEQSIPDPLLERVYTRAANTVNKVTSGISTTTRTVGNSIVGIGKYFFRTKADRYSDERSKIDTNASRTLHSDGTAMRWRRNNASNSAENNFERTDPNETSNSSTDQAEIVIPPSPITTATTGYQVVKAAVEEEEDKYSKYLDKYQKAGLQLIMEWSERNNVPDDIVLYVVQLVSDGLRGVYEEIHSE